jgi:hypothetical protein
MKYGKQLKKRLKKQQKKTIYHIKEWNEKQLFTDQNLILCLKMLYEENGNFQQFSVILIFHKGSI